ncbi:hypothetical protein I5L79_20890 [Hymenobacter sp. BT594]|uniref:P-type ATPase A domain-containing protein n=1 Tax=Hymenobacter guriensis TaxID=2793065 RepID=A0ABS0L782_9BACT|nr:hypothetical protein [Hymenobacter guriensis]
MNRLFKGTVVVNGTGRATVTGVGGGTQLGEIARLMQQAERTATPLEAKLARLTRQLVLLTVGLAGVVLLVGPLLSHWLGRSPSLPNQKTATNLSVK